MPEQPDPIGLANVVLGIILVVIGIIQLVAFIRSRLEKRAASRVDLNGKIARAAKLQKDLDALKREINAELKDSASKAAALDKDRPSPDIAALTAARVVEATTAVEAAVEKESARENAFRIGTSVVGLLAGGITSFLVAFVFK